jgi:hypothetical protein
VADLAAVEARLQAILHPYRDRLEAVEVYGLPFLRRPGAAKHDWFAGVGPAPSGDAIRFFLLPMYHDPSLLEGISPALLKRKRGASVFAFTELDEAQAAELEALVARAFEQDGTSGATA